MKYIRFKNNEIVIFSPSIKHSDMAEFIGGTPVSAGFVKQTEKGLVAHGMSYSLNISSNPLDTDIINSQFVCLE